MTRSKNSASRVFGGPAAKLPEGLELVEADARDPRSLAAAFSFEGSERGRVAAVACCTGTTAFPSKRWQGDNGPKQTDEVGTRNLVEAAKSEGEALKRFVLVSSAGVLVRRDFFSIHVDFLGFFLALCSQARGRTNTGIETFPPSYVSVHLSHLHRIPLTSEPTTAPPPTTTTHHHHSTTQNNTQNHI